jgi:isopentenyl-diphosphate delta-isomerase
MSRRIQIVNENDQPIGSATREEAWSKGLYHRSVHIIIQDEKRNILLQKRSSQKTLYPSKLTNAATGHVDEGETFEESASRELVEEIGINIPLEHLGKFAFHHQDNDRIINHFNGVFLGKISRTTPLKLSPNEVSGTKWFTRNELAESIASHPERFTPIAVEVIRRFILK